MDLKSILAANKSKIGKSKPPRKPVDIAIKDRPYSIPETPLPSPSVIDESRASTDNISNDVFVQSEPEVVINTAQEEAVLDLLQQTDNKVTTKWQQIDNKPITNWQQSDNITATEVATNRQQTDNTQKIFKVNRQQSDNGTGNRTDNKVVTNRQQTDNKVATKGIFSELIGLQRDIVIFICQECKNSRSRITEPLTLEHIAISLKRDTGVIKTTIQRLEKKGYLIRVKFKNGRGGWSQYEVPDSIYHDALRIESDNKVATNRQQSGNKVATEPATELTTTLSSSSSLNIKETTTTELSEEWNFDVSPYEKFGFTKTHIKQLAPLGVISAFHVEQSLMEFNHDFEANTLPPIRTGKINLLMGLFRRGECYVSETYRSEQDQILKLMAERAQKRNKQILEEKFIVWETSLSEEERKNILEKIPTHLMALFKTYGITNSEVKGWLFNYFLNK